MITIRPARTDEAPWLTSRFNSVMGWTKPGDYFQTVIDKQKGGDLVPLLNDAESRIVTRSAVAGIGFGLNADYGAASLHQARIPA